MFPARTLHRSAARAQLFHKQQISNDDVEPQSQSLELYLAAKGVISPDDMMRVMALSQRQETSQADILSRLEMVDDTTLARHQAIRLGERFLELDHDPPNPEHIRRWGPAKCLQTGVMPWRMRNGHTVVATSQPELFERHKADLQACFGPVKRAVATAADIQTCIEASARDTLTQRAETRVAEQESCRTLNYRKLKIGTAACISALCAAIWIWPIAIFLILTVWALIALVCNTVIRCAAALFYLRDKHPDDAPTADAPVIARMPRISILVPLFKERAIATQLVKRMRRLNYPKELLDIHLVVEEDDATTRDTLARTPLPAWMSTLIVPPGGLKTKPRALNYALDHCKGSIVGVYDAEDAPDPYQLKRIVRRFSERGPEVVCLQGTLDFYNARANWLSRCFTIEYATWFRIVLPGLQKLGLAVPLGGTTLFFRKSALEELGGWDAHNVTEDADLGIRLARHGYRTELIPTVTYEEANCRTWPWVKQRSRWLKGYAITYLVHMRNPKTLWGDLGAWRFFGVQMLFLGTLSSFVLAPLLWTFWLAAFGLPHPLTGILPIAGFWTLGGLFFFAEILTITVGMLSVTAPHHKHLIKWVPTLHVYFPLATIASYKALWELVVNPFYWDKTAHGVSEADTDETALRTTPPPHALDVSQTPDLGAVSRLHTRILHHGSR
ncbi:MAG: glycosyltransferase [Planktomarina sp.]